MEKISISVNSGNLLLSPPNETRAPVELHPYSDSTSFSNNISSPSFAILASFIFSCILRHCLFSFKIYGIYSTNATRPYYALKNTVLTVHLNQYTSQQTFKTKKRTEFGKGEIENVDRFAYQRLPRPNVYKTKMRIRMYDTERDCFCIELREIPSTGLRILIRSILQTCSDELIAMNRRLNSCHRLDNTRNVNWIRLRLLFRSRFCSAPSFYSAPSLYFF